MPFQGMSGDAGPLLLSEFDAKTWFGVRDGRHRKTQPTRDIQVGAMLDRHGRRWATIDPREFRVFDWMLWFCMLVDSVRWDEHFHEKYEGTLLNN